MVMAVSRMGDISVTAWMIMLFRISTANSGFIE
jgi:hypothetical protein